MKKHFTKYLLPFLTLLTSPVCLQAGPPNFAADVNVGYRQDQFTWKSRDPQTPDDPTTSETWKNLQIFDVNAFMSYTSCTSWYFRVNGNYGRIYSGNIVDKDYLQNGNSETLIEVNHGNGGRGEVFDVAGGAGFAFKSSGGRLMIAPLIGYIHSEQHLRMSDLDNRFLLGADPLGHIDGAHSTYNTRWYGGFAGYDFLLNWSCALKFFGTLQAEMGNYRAKAHWNLRDDINGYVYHKANFVGFYGTLGFLYNVYCNNYIGISGTYRNLWTHHGSQKMNRRTYLYDMFSNYVGHTHEDYHQKFHARWRSWSVLANWATLF